MIIVITAATTGIGTSHPCEQYCCEGFAAPYTDNCTVVSSDDAGKWRSLLEKRRSLYYDKIGVDGRICRDTA